MNFRTIFFGLCITVISCKGDNSTTKKSSVVANDTTAVAAQQEEDIYKQQSDTIIFTLDQPVIFPEDIINEGVFRVVEEMPEFPGGIEALQEYLKPKTYILKKHLNRHELLSNSSLTRLEHCATSKSSEALPPNWMPKLSASAKPCLNGFLANKEEKLWM